jgi:hypothetical protein
MLTRRRSRGLISIAFVSWAVAGCGTPHATYAPDGRRSFVITCNGFLNSYSTCLVKAGRACGNNGYDTLKGGDDDRSLFIACKVPPVTKP